MKVGMVLSGGGVRGAAHLGVITAFEEAGIVADMYAGASAGAVVASFKALGVSNEVMLEYLKEMGDYLIDINYWGIVKSLPSKFKNLDGFLKGKKMKQFLKEKTNRAMIAHVKKPLAIVSCDINTASQVVFTSHKLKTPQTIDDHIVVERYCHIPLYQLMYASAAIPGLFPPIEYQKMTLIDGSVVNNLPVNVLKAMGAHRVIAIELINRHEEEKPKGVMDILNRSINVMIEQNMDLASKGNEDCLYLNAQIQKTGFLDFDKMIDTYKEGYEYGKEVVDRVKAYLERV